MCIRDRLYAQKAKEQIIKKTTLELLQDNGYSEVKIEDIHLPISYTFFSEKVVSEVIIINNKSKLSIQRNRSGSNPYKDRFHLGGNQCV